MRWTRIALSLALILTSSFALAASNERGLAPANLDKTCSPCKDFDRFANGTWLDANPIPAEYTSWGTWHEVRERNLHRVRRILEETAAEEHPHGSIKQKVGDYYFTAMDTGTIEAAQLAPLAADLKRIADLNSVDDLRRLIATYHTLDFGVLFNVGVEQDLVDSDHYIVYSTQGGLGLPDRDYYLKDDEESEKIRQQYKQHVGAMLVLAGASEHEAQRQSETIMALETDLARASMPRVELRKPENYYNLVTVADASAEMTHLNWADYFQVLGLPELESWSMAQPDFFAAINNMMGSVPLDDWKAYLRWHLITDAAPYLSTEFVTEDFRFYRQVLAGAEEIQPRWKRVQTAMNRRLGETVGQLYVAEAFPPEAKARAMVMIENLRAAVKDRLAHLDWMDDDTKKQALRKLSTFTPKIGYPDKWRDYSALDIERDSYLANVHRAEAFEFQRNLKKLGQPIDRTEWGMAPQIVNAYYNPLLNEIVFPAGILQPPFFDFGIDDAVNYGAMGAVIGHELLHGFDDQGRKFDADGNMQNWWTESDESKFQERAQRLVDQYDDFEVVEGHHISGEQTLGENIADLGGLTMSYYALQKALEGTSRDMINGLTPEQRFFLSWAQVWRRNVREEALKLQVQTDYHSPARWRINGPLSNMPEFYEAFGCDEGDEMVNPTPTRVTIW